MGFSQFPPEQNRRTIFRDVSLAFGTVQVPFDAGTKVLFSPVVEGTVVNNETTGQNEVDFDVSAAGGGDLFLTPLAGIIIQEKN